MALQVLSTLLFTLLGFANAIPAPTISDRDAQAATCSNDFMQSTIDQYITTHSGWTITFARAAWTETTDTDGVLAGVTPAVGTGLCSFSVNITPPATDSNPANTFNFELMLPSQAKWNRRFLTLGNSAFSGCIERYYVGNGLANGYASMGTNTGHACTGNGGDQSWATDPNKRLDWAYRAMDRSIDLAKVMVAAYYNGLTINHSYYSGCSTGGRQGLKQITVNPNSFDGILVGAPAWDEKHLLAWVTYITDADYEAGADGLTVADYAVIDAFVINSCEKTPRPGFPQDDGLIPNSNWCNATLDWTSSLIRCTSAGQANCLNDNKIAVAKAFSYDAYTPYTTNRGGLLFPGYFPGAARQWGTYIPGSPPPSLAFSQQYEADFLGLGTVTWKNDAQKIVQAVEQPDDWTVQDLSKLNYGGKIILYHGSADGYIPTRSSQYLFNQTGELFSDRDSWFKYFEIPGMHHCFQDSTITPAGTKPVPYYMGGAGQSVLTSSYYIPNAVGINDTQHDGLLALVNWVETSTAPTSLITTAFKEGTKTPTTASTIYRQRPVCPYPNMPTWNSNLDPNLSTSWHC